MTLQTSEDWHKQMAAQSGFVTPEAVAELLKDKARLDWLEKECPALHVEWVANQGPDYARFCITQFATDMEEYPRESTGKTIREAIDCAISTALNPQC